MLNIIKKYKFSLFLAAVFHVMLFSAIFINWQPEQKHSKKIVLKQGDVIQATAVSIQQYKAKIKEINNKVAQKKEHETARKKVLKRKEKLNKERKKKRLKEQAKKKADEKKRKDMAKKKAVAKKKAQQQKKLKQEKEYKRVAQEKKRLKEEQKKKEKAVAEKRKKAQQKKAQQRKDAEKRRKQAALKRQQEIKAESEKLEADRARREKGIIDRYAKLIQNKITRYWRRPSNVETKMKCTLNIRMTPSGDVISVKVIKGSGNYSFDRAAEKAVTGASPLPVPTDVNIFNRDFRNLTINYEK